MINEPRSSKAQQLITTNDKYNEDRLEKAQRKQTKLFLFSFTRLQAMSTAFPYSRHAGNKQARRYANEGWVKQRRGAKHLGWLPPFPCLRPRR